MELLVAEKLTALFWQTVTKNTDSRWVDLIVEDWGLLIEVKYDRMVWDTGNYVFEFMCNEKESGIEKQYNSEEWWKTRPHFFVQAHAEWFEIYHTYKLLEYVKEHKTKIVKGWDWWRSSMYLIEAEKVRPLAIKTFNN